MSSNPNINESADISSNNIYNATSESENYLLENNSESSNSSSHLKIQNTNINKQNSVDSNSHRNSIISANYTSEPEYIDIKSEDHKNHENHVGFENYSPLNEHSFFQSGGRSNVPLKNFYNDICIPLEKINGSKNIEDFYKINFEKFQQFCDKPGKVKSVAYKNSDLDNLRRRKLSKDSYVSKSTTNIDNNDLLKDSNSSDRIIFYCKSNDNNSYIQRVHTFQNLKPIDSEPISETMKNKFFWIDVLKPTKEEIAVLSDIFGIHPLTVEDMEYDDTREKMETFINYYYLSINSFEEDTLSDIHPINVSVLVYKNFVLSFHNKPIQHTENILRRIVQLSYYDFEFNGDWIAYAHIDDIADSFIPYISSVEIEVNTVDELVLILKESEKNDMLRRIGVARKHVTTLLRLITDKLEVIKSLIKRISALYPNSNNLLYLSDVQDHIITMVQNLTHYDQTLVRAHSNYLAQINIEITLATNDTNDIANKLSVLGTVFLPLSLISGMWGMNVIVPGQNYDSLIPFFVICLSMVVISIFTIYLSKRLGMI